VRLVYERLEATGTAVADPPRAGGDGRGVGAQPDPTVGTAKEQPA
jgi:hypothetical protein